MVETVGKNVGEPFAEREGDEDDEERREARRVGLEKEELRYRCTKDAQSRSKDDNSDRQGRQRRIVGFGNDLRSCVERGGAAASVSGSRRAVSRLSLERCFTFLTRCIADSYSASSALLPTRPSSTCFSRRRLPASVDPIRAADSPSDASSSSSVACPSPPRVEVGCRIDAGSRVPSARNGISSC